MYESRKYNKLQKKIGLQCYPTIPQRVAIIYDNQIDLNEDKDVFKDLDEVPPPDDWFPYEYIYAEVNKKVDKTKGQISGDQMEKETKHYEESLNHDPNWLKTITIGIGRFLIDCEYINFFMQIYIQ